MRRGPADRRSAEPAEMFAGAARDAWTALTSDRLAPWRWPKSDVLPFRWRSSWPWATSFLDRFCTESMTNARQADR